jgi:hypothetical protein
MSRLDDFEAILTKKKTDALAGQDAADAWVLRLLAHTGFADAQYAQEEYDVLELLMPDKDVGEILEFMVEQADAPFDLEGLKKAFASTLDRRTLTRIAEHMVAADREVLPEEKAFVEKLKKALQV